MNIPRSVTYAVTTKDFTVKKKHRNHGCFGYSYSMFPVDGSITPYLRFSVPAAARKAYPEWYKWIEEEIPEGLVVRKTAYSYYLDLSFPAPLPYFVCKLLRAPWYQEHHVHIWTLLVANGINKRVAAAMACHLSLYRSYNVSRPRILGYTTTEYSRSSENINICADYSKNYVKQFVKNGIRIPKGCPSYENFVPPTPADTCCGGGEDRRAYWFNGRIRALTDDKRELVRVGFSTNHIIPENSLIEAAKIIEKELTDEES